MNGGTFCIAVGGVVVMHEAALALAFWWVG